MSSLMSEIEGEVNQQPNEDKEEYNYGFDGRVDTLNVSSIVNSIFAYLSKSWSEEERQRLLLNEFECKLFDKAVTPIVYRIALRLGLAVSEAFSVLVITSLLLPRIFLYFSLSRKHEKTTKTVDKVGA